MENEKFQYLKSESCYSDFYDRLTVEACRRWEKVISKGGDPGKNKIQEDAKNNLLISVGLYFLKGERYAQKADTIKEWMKRDEMKDELLASARPPEVQCLTCGSDLVPDYKDLRDGAPGKKDRVLFMYSCPKGCLPRRAFFDDGEEWRPKPRFCPKCSSGTEETAERSGDMITYTCPSCGHKEEEILDLAGKPEAEKTDRNFEKDRNRFCMLSKEGEEYLDSRERLDSLSRLVEEKEKKEKIQKVLAGIKKISVAGLKERLVPLLEKEGYTKLELSKPEIGRDVIIQFNIQDSRPDRGEYDSEFCLRKTIKSDLEKTNWRLMSGGIFYKLGVLSGRLRGYEADEDLLKLIKPL